MLIRDLNWEPKHTSQVCTANVTKNGSKKLEHSNAENGIMHELFSSYHNLHHIF